MLSKEPIKTGESGGGGSTPTSVDLRRNYINVYDSTVHLGAEDQYARLKSVTDIANVVFPPKSAIEDGHFVVLQRAEGDKAQLVKSDDTPVALPPLVESQAALSLTLNGDSIDTGPNATVMTETGVTYVEDTFDGQTHDVMETASDATGIQGLTADFTPVTGGDPRTVYFQYKSNGATKARDKAGFFGLGDVSAGNKLFALEGTGGSGNLRIHCKNVLINYDKSNMPDIFDGNVHTIAVTSASSSISDIELYIDDMVTPITKGALGGTGSVDTAAGAIQVGWSKSADDCVPGRYSNFRVYDSVLSSDELRILQIQGLQGASDLTTLDLNEEIRFIYDATNNIWQAIDATLYRILEYNERLNDLENPADKPAYEAVSLVAQTIPTTADGTLVQFETEHYAKLVEYSAGEFTLNEGGFHLLACDLANDGEMEVWLETYDTDTSTWIGLSDSAEVSKGADGHTEYSYRVTAVSSQKFRVMARATTVDVNLTTSVLANGVSAPSTRVFISHEGSVSASSRAQVLVDPPIGLQASELANKLVIDTQLLTLTKHNAMGHGGTTYGLNVIGGETQDSFTLSDEITFDTGAAVGHDIDVVLAYPTGKAMLHIVDMGYGCSVLQGIQVGEELPFTYSYETGGNGNHFLKVTNVGNTIDIQLKTLKTKLFGGL